jgi:hypothetical protein
MPEDSFCSATAVQEETYAIWLYGETQSQARSQNLAVSLVCNRPDGKRLYHKKIVGTVEYPDENAARRSVVGAGLGN